MPKLVRSLPQYRKHQAYGQAIVEFIGQTLYLGPYGTKATRREYDRLIAEWITAGRSSLPVASATSFTISKLILAYWRFAKQHYGKHGEPTSEQDAIRSALRPLRNRYGQSGASC